MLKNNPAKFVQQCEELNARMAVQEWLELTIYIKLASLLDRGIKQEKTKAWKVKKGTLGMK